MSEHILVTGNPVDGFRFLGPFPTVADASLYPDGLIRFDDDWWIAPLERPEYDASWYSQYRGDKETP